MKKKKKTLSDSMAARSLLHARSRTRQCGRACAFWTRPHNVDTPVAKRCEIRDGTVCWTHLVGLDGREEHRFRLLHRRARLGNL